MSFLAQRIGFKKQMFFEKLHISPQGIVKVKNSSQMEPSQISVPLRLFVKCTFVIANIYVQTRDSNIIQ